MSRSKPFDPKERWERRVQEWVAANPSEVRRIIREEMDAQSERAERWRWETTSDTDPE